MTPRKLSDDRAPGDGRSARAPEIGAGFLIPAVKLSTRPANGWLSFLPTVLAAVVGLSSATSTLYAGGITDLRGQAALGYAATSGNSETEQLSLRVRAKSATRKGEFRIDLGGRQTATTSFNSFAEFSETGELVLVEEPSTSLSDEEYWAKADFRHRVKSGKTFLFGGFHWDRNEPRRIRNRYSGIAGAGRYWLEGDSKRFLSEFGFTINRERSKQAVGFTQAADEYPGLWVHWDGRWQSAEGGVRYTNQLEVNQNLEDRKDLRAEMTQALEVGINEQWFIELGLDFDYYDDPGVRRVRVKVDGQFTNDPPLRVPLDKLDSRFTTSIGVRF